MPLVVLFWMGVRTPSRREILRVQGYAAYGAHSVPAAASFEASVPGLLKTPNSDQKPDLACCFMPPGCTTAVMKFSSPWRRAAVGKENRMETLADKGEGGREGSMMVVKMMMVMAMERMITHKNYDNYEDEAGDDNDDDDE